MNRITILLFSSTLLALCPLAVAAGLFTQSETERRNSVRDSISGVLGVSGFESGAKVDDVKRIAGCFSLLDESISLFAVDEELAMRTNLYAIVIEIATETNSFGVVEERPLLHKWEMLLSRLNDDPALYCNREIMLSLGREMGRLMPYSTNDFAAEIKSAREHDRQHPVLLQRSGTPDPNRRPAAANVARRQREKLYANKAIARVRARAVKNLAKPVGEFRMTLDGADDVSFTNEFSALAMLTPDERTLVFSAVPTKRLFVSAGTKARSLLRMKAVRLPCAAFEDSVSLADAVKFLCSASREYAPLAWSEQDRAQGLDFAFPVDMEDFPIPRLRASNVSLLEVVRQLCAKTGFEMNFYETIVLLSPKDCESCDFTIPVPYATDGKGRLDWRGISVKQRP